MDFDSLKVTAKINSGVYENKSSEHHQKVSKPSVDTSGNVSGGTNVRSVAAVNSSESGEGNNNGEQSVTSKEFLQQLDNAVKVANEHLKSLMIRKEFSYRVHEETNRLIVNVKNMDTGEIIREIPSEKELDIAAKIHNLEEGIIVDERS